MKNKYRTKCQYAQPNRERISGLEVRFKEVVHPNITSKKKQA